MITQEYIKHTTQAMARALCSVCEERGKIIDKLTFVFKETVSMSSTDIDTNYEDFKNRLTYLIPPDTTKIINNEFELFCNTIVLAINDSNFSLKEGQINHCEYDHNIYVLHGANVLPALLGSSQPFDVIIVTGFLDQILYYSRSVFHDKCDMFDRLRTQLFHMTTIPKEIKILDIQQEYRGTHLIFNDNCYSLSIPIVNDKQVTTGNYERDICVDITKIIGTCTLTLKGTELWATNICFLKTYLPLYSDFFQNKFNMDFLPCFIGETTGFSFYVSKIPYVKLTINTACDLTSVIKEI